MRKPSLALAKTPKGRWKAYILGQTDDHIMDWRGCNFRRATIEGQPHRGYATREEAYKFLQEKFKDNVDVGIYAGKAGDGTFMSEEWYIESGAHENDGLHPWRDPPPLKNNNLTN